MRKAPYRDQYYRKFGKFSFASPPSAIFSLFFKCLRI